MAEPALPLLNLFEVETEGRRRHVVCFLDPVRAGALGIDSRAVIGEYSPGPGGEFDLETFHLNPHFVTAFTLYMNGVTAHASEVIDAARSERSGWLYLLDPRYRPGNAEETPGRNLLGCFAVDDSGQIVPGSFQYNSQHVWFDPVDGVSGILRDRRFYDWLHPAPETRADSPSNESSAP